MQTAGCVIVAGGVGKRLGGPVRKQFLPLNGKEILVHSIEAFARCGAINEIVIVSHADDVALCENLVKQYALAKVTAVRPGGRERQHSVYNGLQLIQSDIVLIHDAVRPFIQIQTIENAIRCAAEYGACVPGVKVKDTIKIADDNAFVVSTPKRDSLYAVQTPQAFRRQLILQAHEQAQADPITATDDCALVERFNHPVKIIEGDYNNIKITTAEDLLLAEKIFAQFMENQV